MKYEYFEALCVRLLKNYVVGYNDSNTTFYERFLV